MVEFFKNLIFFIMPLGFGSKRIQFFKNEIKKLGGILSENEKNVTYVVIEDSVCENKENCLLALRKHGFDVKNRNNVKFVRVKWISKCLGCKRLVDSKAFELDWNENDLGEVLSVDKNWIEKKEEETEKEKKDEGESPEKKKKMEFENYICSKPSTAANSISEKEKIIEELEKLANIYQVQNDTWRCHSYRKAISAIMIHDKEINTLEDALSIPGVGYKMALKILEIVELGKLQKTNEILDEKTKVLDVFCKIWGVGPSTAEGWYAQGFRSLDDLVMNKAKLTRQQQIGLKLYANLQKRIPREEVREIGKIVENEVKKINETLTVELVGSYRRGSLSCGDVDCMIVNPGVLGSSEILYKVTQNLKANGFLPDDLISLENDTEDENHHKKYFGIFILPGDNKIHRRIDLFVVPKSQYAPALPHYTGSALFNRSIKLLAAKKNMTLTESGLYTQTVRKGSEVTCKGELVNTQTEEEIFIRLGLPYTQPENRS